LHREYDDCEGKHYLGTNLRRTTRPTRGKKKNTKKRRDDVRDKTLDVAEGKRLLDVLVQGGQMGTGHNPGGNSKKKKTQEKQS